MEFLAVLLIAAWIIHNWNEPSKEEKQEKQTALEQAIKNGVIDALRERELTPYEHVQQLRRSAMDETLSFAERVHFNDESIKACTNIADPFIKSCQLQLAKTRAELLEYLQEKEAAVQVTSDFEECAARR